MQSLLVVPTIFLISFYIPSILCMNEQKIREITKRFEESVSEINKKVSCQVSTVKDRNGCLLKAYTDKCKNQPSLKILHNTLFPLTDLEKLTGGFIDEEKFSVILYTANLCNKNDSFFELSLQSSGSYQIAERFISTSKTELNVKFSASDILKSFNDISINSGHSISKVNEKKFDIYFKSALNNDEIIYDFKVDILSSKDIIQLFQLHSIDYVFDENEVNNNVVSLKSLIFLDAIVAGKSIPSSGFEFYITGTASGNEVLAKSKKVVFIVQKRIMELSDVKCFLYCISNEPSYLNFNNLYSRKNFFSDIPFFKPANGSILLVVANNDLNTFSIEKIEEDLSNFIDMSASRKNIIEKGFYVYYVLERLSSKTETLVGENEEEGSTSKERGLGKSLNDTNDNKRIESYTGILRTNIPDNRVEPDLVAQDEIISKKDKIEVSAANTTTGDDIFAEEKIIDRGYKFSDVTEASGEQGSQGENQENQLLSSDAPYFVYKIQKTNTDEFKIEPEQLIVSNYEQLAKYVLGEEKAKEWCVLPLYNTLELMLNKIVLSKASGELKIYFDVTQTVPFSVIDNFIEFKVLAYNISYTFDKKANPASQWFLTEGSQDYEKDGESIPSVIFDEKKSKYFLNDTLDVYCQNDLVQEYGISPLKECFKKTFEELSKFSFKKPCIVVEIQKDIHKALIKADGIVLDNDIAAVESLLWQHGRTKEITTSLLLRNMGLDEFLKELFQKKMLKTCWLDMKKIILAFSSAANTTIGDDIFAEEKIIDRGYKFSDNLAVFGSMDITLKTGCLDDPVCNFIKNHITHDFKATLSGEITTTSYQFKSIFLEGSTSFGNIWGISKVILNVIGDGEKNSGTSLEGFITHKPTRNNGRFFVGQDTVKGNIVCKLILMKEWNEFLGFKNIRLMNINSNMDVSGDEMLKKLELSSTLVIGSSEQPIHIPDAKVIIDMKKSDCENNVVYVKMKNITVADFRKAFTGLARNKLLDKMSFQDDLKICFTNKQQGYQVEEFGSYIFNPTCNALAKMTTFAGNVTVQFDFNQMLFHFQPQLLKYQDDRLIVRRRKSSESGPYFVSSLGNGDDSGTWKMKGYIETIGYEGPIKLQLNSSALNFKFSTFLFNEIKGKGEVKGDIDTDMSKATYSFELDKKLTTKQVVKHLKNLILMETKMIQKDIISHCEMLVKNISDLESDMRDKRSGMMSLSETKRSDVFRKKAEVENANEFIRKDCITSCGKKCVTALDWDHDCSNVRGQKFGCLKWKRCQSEAANTNCIAICQAKKFSHSHNAYIQRDKIRYLVEDISEIRDKINKRDASMSSVEALLSKAEALLRNANTKFSFILNIDLDADGLIAFDQALVSTQKLSNIKPPCIEFDNISFKFKGYGSKTVSKQSFCAGGSFYKDISNSILKSIDSEFENIAETKSEVMVDVIGLETSYKDLYQKYKEETDEESDDPAYGDIFSSTRTIHFPSTGKLNVPAQNNSLFNDTSMGGVEKKVVKRDSENDVIQNELDADAELFEATEMEIAEFVTKDSRTFKVFDIEAPWIYMNKKRGVTIPPLGMLHFKENAKNSTCHRRRDTIEHFEDLLGSLKDAKQFYDEGRETMQHITEELQGDKREIISEMNKAKDEIQSRTLQRDMVFWMERAKEGIDEYIASVGRQLEHQDKVGLKYWSTQLNSAVRSSIPGKVSDYFHKLRDHVLSTFKKSNKRSKIEGKDAVDFMTREFIDIAEKEPLLSELKDRLNRISKKINDFKRTSITKCKS